MSTTVFSPCRVWRYTLVRDLVGRIPIEDMRNLEYANGCPSCNDQYYVCSEPDVCLGVRKPRSVLFVGLNPSTADEVKNDPTVRRMAGFARSWRFEQLVVCNVYALRSTDPAGLSGDVNPVGVDNDYWILGEAAKADRVVAAWGGSGPCDGRRERLGARLRAAGAVYALGFTGAGHPRHPLYLRSDTVAVPWRG